MNSLQIREKLDEWVNWNYIGLIAGVLSVAVTLWNISNYYDEIKKQGGSK